MKERKTKEKYNTFFRSCCSCSGYDYLVDGGVHLSPDVQGQVEQQEQEVSHRERGQEQGGVVIGVTLPPKRKRLICLACKLTDFINIFSTSFVYDVTCSYLSSRQQ